MTTTDYADAAADLLAEQRRARLDQCSITVYTNDMYAPTGEHYATWSVYIEDAHQMTFHNEDDAWTYAYELASDMLDDGDWE